LLLNFSASNSQLALWDANDFQANGPVVGSEQCDSCCCNEIAKEVSRHGYGIAMWYL
jgi:hypothetical protein